MKKVAVYACEGLGTTNEKVWGEGGWVGRTNIFSETFGPTRYTELIAVTGHTNNQDCRINRHENRSIERSDSRGSKQAGSTCTGGPKLVHPDQNFWWTKISVTVHLLPDLIVLPALYMYMYLDLFPAY